MKKRHLYLNNTPPDEAKEQYLSALGNGLEPKYETVPVREALGRMTRQAVWAKYSSPLYNCSAMDGIAVIAKRTEGARETAPVTLCMGEDFVIVDTGDPVHAPYDAVIMAEDIQEVDETHVLIFAAAHPWQHLRPVGEDIVAGEMILPTAHTIRPIDIGVLLSAGITEVEVVRKPRVAIFPTGSELIESGSSPREGDIIESNSYMFQAMVRECGGLGERFAPIPDVREQIRDAVRAVVDDFDLVLINAGSSAGTEDYTVDVLQELGEVVIHGVAIKPGKPVILAVVEGKPVIGLPGYPVSAYLGFEHFVRPVLQRLLGRQETSPSQVQAVAAKRMVSTLKYKEFIRVKLGRVGNTLVASPLARSAGAAMSLVRADGFCVVEQNREGIEAGETVSVELCRSMDDVDNTLVVIGSHDMLLDVVADRMSSESRYFLSSTHVGSLAGLMALKNGQAHIAPCHLLDPEGGDYNLSYLRRIFSEPVALVKGVGRIQGIMVKKGNPLNIHSIQDLQRVRYVNRQRGAGTRVLLDHLLAEEGIAPDTINGYDREAATHMAVAAMVAGDSADAGMGILPAATAMGLDFIEIGTEEYDFALRPNSLQLPMVQAFLHILTGEAFQSTLNQTGGYSFSRTGEIIVLE